MTAHRTPEPADRVRDAERTKRCLLEAALDEFAAHGYAGARVSEIAARARVNKQLITYYFGGKAGLYTALQRYWQERERDIDDPGLPLADVVLRYLEHVLHDPRGLRLLMWRGLSDAETPSGITPITETDLAEARTRQRRGEIAADLDPAAYQLAILGMVAAPVLLPAQVRTLFGIDPQTPEFERHYGEQLRRIISRLAESNEQGVQI